MANYSLSAVLELKDKFSTNIRTFERKTSAISKSSSIAGSAIVALDKKLKGMGSSALNAGKRLAQGLGVATAASTMLAFKGAADMETYMGQLETAFRGNKEIAQDYFMWANRMANATPFENSEVIEATSKLSMYGLEAKKTFTIVGDMAASLGKPLMQAVEAIADARKGSFVRMEEFAIKPDDIVAYGKKIGFNDLVDNKGSIKDTGKFFEVMMKLIESRTEGGMVRLAKTFKGQWSTILGQTKFTLARFAGMNENGTVRAGSAFERLKNVAEGVIKKINSSLDDGTVDKWIEKLDKGVADASVYLNNLWEDIKNITGDDLTKWADGVKSSFEALATIANGLATTVKYLAENQKFLRYGAAALAGGMVGGIPGAVAAVAALAGRDLGKGAVENIKYELDTGKTAPVFGDRKEVTDYIENVKKNKNTTPQLPEKVSPNSIMHQKQQPIINVTGNMTFNNGMDINNFTQSLADRLLATQ